MLLLFLLVPVVPSALCNIPRARLVPVLGSSRCAFVRLVNARNSSMIAAHVCVCACVVVALCCTVTCSRTSHAPASANGKGWRGEGVCNVRACDSPQGTIRIWCVCVCGHGRGRVHSITRCSQRFSVQSVPNCAGPPEPVEHPQSCAKPETLCRERVPEHARARAPLSTQINRIAVHTRCAICGRRASTGACGFCAGIISFRLGKYITRIAA